MVRASPEHGSGSPKRLTISFFISISAVVTRFAKQASRFSIKLTKPPIKNNNHPKKKPIKNKNKEDILNSKTSSMPPSPKQLITSISNKAITLIQHRKKIKVKDNVFGGSHDEFGDGGGVWQREILMGDKCQPLDFSGAIYYDSSGKQLNEVPLRSPRASPLPGYLARGTLVIPSPG